jgi:DNA-binding transcriptional LysR family regulator
MDLRQLSYFVAVAEEGQFTRAAERVLVAQPAVSAQIRRLEAELGEPLFHRDRRTAKLTAAGEALLPHARAALAAAERGRDTIASLRGLLHGRLEVGVAGPIDHRFAEALGDFHRAHPAIEIGFRQQLREPVLRAVADGQVDIGVVGVDAEPLPPPLRSHVVTTEPLVVAVREGDSLSARKTIVLEQLREWPMVTLMRGSGLRTFLEDACREAGFTAEVVAETGDLVSLVQLVAAGLGVAVVPRSATDGAPVAVIKMTRPRLERRTALAWNESHISPAGRAFLELATEHFEKPRPA